MTTDRRLHADSIVVSAGRPTRDPGAPVNVPVSLTSTYVAGGEVGYARVGTSSWRAFEDAIGALEGGEALAFSSGMAAIAAVFGTIPSGGTIVAPGDSYTGTRLLLAEEERRGAVVARLVDISDTAATLAACDGADLLFIESPTNPMLNLADIRALAQGARRAGARVVVDNTFATPLLQRPLDLGADAVVHSATKFLAGHSDLLMGVAVTRDRGLLARLQNRRTFAGAIPGPFEAFLALRGLRTLGVRLERSQANASEIAVRLSQHAAVTRVRYPGFGAVLAFEVGGDAALAERVCEAAQLITHTTSLGGVETTMERRRRHPAEDLVPDDLIRISVGIEHVEDIWIDLSGALDSAAA